MEQAQEPAARTRKRVGGKPGIGTRLGRAAVQRDGCRVLRYPSDPASFMGAAPAAVVATRDGAGA